MFSDGNVPHVGTHVFLGRSLLDQDHRTVIHQLQQHGVHTPVMQSLSVHHAPSFLSQHLGWVFLIHNIKQLFFTCHIPFCFKQVSELSGANEPDWAEMMDGKLFEQIDGMDNEMINLIYFSGIKTHKGSPRDSDLSCTRSRPNSSSRRCGRSTCHHQTFRHGHNGPCR